MSYQEVLEKFGLVGDDAFRSQMLSRLKSDCDYYLGYGCRSTKNLWAQNEEDHIDCMEALWESFGADAKPEWLTAAKLAEYAGDMAGLDARIFEAYDRRWEASEAVKEQAAEYRRLHPGLSLDSTGLGGCAFHYKTLNEANKAVVVLKILPEYFMGNKEIEALTAAERQEAYRALIPLVEKGTAHKYLLDKVEMTGFGMNDIQNEKVRVIGGDGRIHRERSLDEMAL